MRCWAVPWSGTTADRRHGGCPTAWAQAGARWHPHDGCGWMACGRLGIPGWHAAPRRRPGHPPRRLRRRHPHRRRIPDGIRDDDSAHGIRHTGCGWMASGTTVAVWHGRTTSRRSGPTPSLQPRRWRACEAVRALA
ncbi:MAG: hypothetical protein MUD01_08395 [Chloroflexaceae bacterium]|nr:hypothetical protein [Chloroflexaceae bacterium]